jgi:hypothetical protein
MRKAIIIIVAALACSPAYALQTNDHGTTNNYYDQGTTNQGGQGGTGVGIGIGGGASVKNSVTVSPRITTSNNQAQIQGQSMNGSNNAEQSTLVGGQSVRFEAKNYLPNLPGSVSADTRNPELQQSNERALIEAANAEIAGTVGKGLNTVYHYSADGVTAEVAYNDIACSVHVYPTGSAKGITPAKLEAVAFKAGERIGLKSLALQVSYLSIENHSNGMGASVAPAGSAANADRGLVGGVASALTGNKGRTSERVRIELVFKGTR